MTIAHHPSGNLLLAHASGALPEAWALAVATHASLCADCRTAISALETVGGELIERMPAEESGERLLPLVMARLGERPPAPAYSPGVGSPLLPRPLREYVGGDQVGGAADELPWQRLGRGVCHLMVPTGTKGVTARLLRIPAGRPVPWHGHRGLELTLVLRGAFCDATGRYGPGDFEEADEALSHQPHADPGEDCICLAVTDAPLRFRSLAARLLQPL